jgi:hypothetical protein
MKIWVDWFLPLFYPFHEMPNLEKVGNEFGAKELDRVHPVGGSAPSRCNMFYPEPHIRLKDFLRERDRSHNRARAQVSHDNGNQRRSLTGVIPEALGGIADTLSPNGYD